MLKQNSEPNQHFSAYHEDNALLIQFIMSEFVHTHQITLRIKSLIQEHLDSNLVTQTMSHGLTQLLGQLVGCFPQQTHPSFCRWTRGSLTKLKEYSDQFSKNARYENKQRSNLYMASYQTWLTALHSLELLNSLHFEKKLDTEALRHFTPIKRSFKNLETRFNQVSRYFPQVFKDYWDDENVMLCLLRKNNQLVEIYGTDFLSKRFKWPAKNQNFLQLLSQRYQSRGFENLIPTIHQLLKLQENFYEQPT